MEKQVVVKDIIEIYKSIGLSVEVLNDIEDYLKGAHNEEEILKSIENEQIPNWEFRVAISNVVTKFLKDMNLEDEDLTERILKSFFLIGKENTFDCYEMKFIFENKVLSIYKKLKEIKVPFYYYIMNRVKKVSDKDGYYIYNDINKKYFVELKWLYIFYKKDYIEAFHHLEGVEKLCLAIILLNEGNRKIKGIKEFVDQNLKEILFKYFEINDQHKETINNYINGNHIPVDRAVDSFKSIAKNVGDDEYRIINSIIYHSCNKSEVAKRILKLLAHFDNYRTIDYIFDFTNAGEEKYGRHRIKICEKAQEFLRVLKRLEIEEHFYIAWAAYQCFGEYTYEEDKKFLRSVMNDCFEENIGCFKDAIQITSGIAKNYLESHLINLMDEDEKIDEVNRKCIEAVKDILKEHNFSNDEIDDFVLFMEGNKDIKKVLIPSNFKKNDYLGWGIRKQIKKIVWCYGIGDVFRRIVLYFVKLQNHKLFDYLVNELAIEKKATFKDVVEIFSDLGVEVKDIIYIISTMSFDGHHTREYDHLIDNWIEDCPYEVINHMKLCNAEGREDLIKRVYESGFYKKDKEKFISLLKEFIADSSKLVKATVYPMIEEALTIEERKALGINLLGAKKAAMREGAIHVLKSIMDEECENILKAHLEKEKSTKVKNLIMENLPVATKEEEEIKDINTYCKKNLNKRKRSKISWLEPEHLPNLVLEENGEKASEEVLDYILITFADEKEVQTNLEVKKIMDYFKKDSLNHLAYEVLLKWYDEGAEAKKKWILSLVGMFGDTKCIQFLEKNIKKWPEISRGTIACEALKAIAISGNHEGLMIIDSIGRKFKFKQVKNAALEALDFAAKELGIDKEELSDRVVPTLGFDKEGKQVFDYGNRKFIVEINEELTLTVYKEDGKILKNLPKPGKNDDEEKAEVAREGFKLLKKQLKTLITAQSERLDIALGNNRKWRLEQWKNLFVENMIMQRFAIGLIWGIYEEEKLIKTFRYMEDGSFNTVDEEEIEIGNTEKIGLVHPIELSKETIDLWKEQLEDYEITQPIEQLDRKVFSLEDDTKETIDQFAGIMISGSTFSNKLKKRGWYTGSVRDGGWYTEFYKENEKIGAEIDFSGMGFYDQYETVTIFLLRFYQSGTVERGSYIYDKIEEKDLILPKSVQKRLLSEILYDLYKATVNSSEFDKDWKKEMDSLSNYRE
ncbi:DUF4132 domain-containing protein [Crassaminicella profunda]|uniref:DUF4132 domain-containing protein n=1 Tax=Crassaminicella profunda TaxID=1286698 RepID=UPI001CA6FA4C|nr:DUF4132 domain-containing protein [Crassaminicella profunda]QZY56176.1 DUF4132 domain-containing protein [Crassaminicella profunda]